MSPDLEVWGYVELHSRLTLEIRGESEWSKARGVLIKIELH
jgi:hypothetical protein